MGKGYEVSDITEVLSIQTAGVRSSDPYITGQLWLALCPGYRLAVARTGEWGSDRAEGRRGAVGAAVFSRRGPLRKGRP